MVSKSSIPVPPSWSVSAGEKTDVLTSGAIRFAWIVALLACLAGFDQSRLDAAEVPSGFEVTTILEDINTATAFTFTPDGRILILDQTGTILVVKDGQLLPEPMLTVEVDAFWERGLIGLALHPDFPEVPHLFINHTPGKPYTRHRISRFTVEGDRAIPDSEVILFEGDDQSKLGGGVPHGHQGGPIRFGPDGKLYVALGEQTAGKPSQSIHSLLGKILRLNPDGSIPSDNPFYTQTTGKYRSIWATGIRNPYGLDFHPLTGDLYENDVGQSTWEEINIIQRGANYGWPEAEGHSDNPGFTNPVHVYPPVIGRSITGGTFYRGGTHPFPENYRNQYFFLDFMNHWIRILDPDAPETSKLFGKNFNGPVDIQTGPDGALYVLNRGTIWRDNKRHVDNAGSLQRIRYTGTPLADEPGTFQFPADLAEANVFNSPSERTPQPGFHPFHLNLPRWRADVTMQLWIRVPADRTISASPQGLWHFPAETTMIQHFESPPGTPLETHLYWATSADCFRAAAYRWDETQSNAIRVDDSEIITYGDDERFWFSPGPEECLNLSTSVTGFVLELTTRQLNHRLPDGTEQLAQWQSRGWIAPDTNLAQLVGSDRLVALEDPQASLEEKIRSYLDANCATCHYPGGPSRGGFDARFQTPLKDKQLINAPLLAGDLGIKGARMVVPGSPNQSILYQRVHRKDFFRMPPVVLNNDRSPLADILKQWIENIAP